MTTLITAAEALIKHLESGTNELLSKVERHHIRQELIENLKAEIKHAKSEATQPVTPYDQRR